MRCRYNVVKCPGRAGYGVSFVSSHTDILPPFLQRCVQYHVILDRVITALDCIGCRFSLNISTRLKYYKLYNIMHLIDYIFVWNKILICAFKVCFLNQKGCHIRQFHASKAITIFPVDAIDIHNTCHCHCCPTFLCQQTRSTHLKSPIRLSKKL